MRGVYALVQPEDGKELHYVLLGCRRDVADIRVYIMVIREAPYCISSTDPTAFTGSGVCTVSHRYKYVWIIVGDITCPRGPQRCTAKVG